VERRVHIFGHTIFYNDPRSFFSGLRDIFKIKIYHFSSSKESPVIIDGGGNIGLSVLYFKDIYPESKITVFEPDLEMLGFLKKNIAANSLEDVNVVSAGIDLNEGTVKFTPDHSDGGRINAGGKISVKIDKLSKYINSEVDFLKLDIEGSELNVLEDLDINGKFKYIRELCLEWHSFSEQKQNLGKLLMILEKNNYKYFINNLDYRPEKLIKTLSKLRDGTKFYLIIHAKKYDLLD